MSSFLIAFREYGKSRSDCPPEFFLHAGMTTLAVALGNQVSVEGWSDPIYPNLWAVCIAGSGFGKSVPLNLSDQVLRRAGLGDRVLSASFSKEGLQQEIAQRPQAVFYLPEFAAFMGELQRDYNTGLMAWITNLFDVPEEERRRLVSGTSTLKRPTITILGASTPEWFSESFKASALKGGFLARFLFCPSVEPGAYVGHPGPHNQAVLDSLAEHVRLVSQLSGQADIRGVIKRFNDWDKPYRAHRREWPPEFGGMRNRAGLMVWKAALLFHVSREPDDRALRLRCEDIDLAISYVEQTHEKAEGFLTNEVPYSKEDEESMRALKAIERMMLRQPWAPRSRVLMNTHLGATALDRAERTLYEMGRVEIGKVQTPSGGTEKAYRPARKEPNSG